MGARGLTGLVEAIYHTHSAAANGQLEQREAIARELQEIVTTAQLPGAPTYGCVCACIYIYTCIHVCACVCVCVCVQAAKNILYENVGEIYVYRIYRQWWSYILACL